MRKLLPWLVLPVLVITACGDPPVDPTTLTFTGSGTAQNIASIDTPYTLTNTFSGASIAAGTLNVDKSVTVSVKPTDITPSVKLSTWKANLTTANCNTSQLLVNTDTSYYVLSNLNFTEDTTQYNLDAGSVTTNADGTKSYVRHKFFYVKTAGSMSGTVTCTDTPTTRTYDVQLQPGWNIITQTYTYNLTTQQFTNYSYSTGPHTNTYSGPWVIYSAN